MLSGALQDRSQRADDRRVSGMKQRLVAAALAAAAALSLAAPAGAASPAPGPPGQVRFVQVADSSFDRFTYSPDPAEQAWMRDHYWRMRTWAPYFDSRTSWYPGAWMYSDAYAIYKGSYIANDHPEWILRDAQGNRLFIQFACANGTCPQYAADIGSPSWRAGWIARAREHVRLGYAGLWVDDVNMEVKVSNGNGDSVAPIDPRTGTPMTKAVWQRYMADFMEEVRAAFREEEVVHNALWFMNDEAADERRQLRAADVINLERGVNDAGLTGGDGPFSLRKFLEFIDRRHEDGVGVILDANASTVDDRLYNLAAYFLISSGRDSLGNGVGGRPSDWWEAYDVDLGTPAGPRYDADGVFRRDFSGGTVLVNEPDAPARTVALGPGYRDLGGVARSSVTLGPASGAVLLREGAPAQTTRTTVTAAPARAAAAPPREAARETRADARPVRSRGRRVRVRGRVRGASGGVVDIVLERRAGRRWARSRRASATVSAGGRFSRVLPRVARGRYRVQARFRGHGPAQPSRSPYRAFRAR
jgi:hypothetical protein